MKINQMGIKEATKYSVLVVLSSIVTHFFIQILLGRNGLCV